MSLISKDTLLHNVADAYRTASGTTAAVKAGELAQKISELTSGGGGGWVRPADMPQYTDDMIAAPFVGCYYTVGLKTTVKPWFIIKGNTTNGFRVDRGYVENGAFVAVSGEDVASGNNKIFFEWCDLTTFTGEYMVYRITPKENSTITYMSIPARVTPEGGEGLYVDGQTPVLEYMSRLPDVSAWYGGSYESVASRYTLAVTISDFNTNGSTTISNMFSNKVQLKQVRFIGEVDTSSVTTMANMFSSCFSLQNLDLSSFDTSSVTNMSQMFYNCYSLQNLDLSSFDTSSVANMSQMFNGCSSLQNLDLSSFDTSSVTTMASMFYSCPSLQSAKFPDGETHYFPVSGTPVKSWVSNNTTAITSGSSIGSNFLTSAYILRDITDFFALPFSFTISSANALTVDSLMEVINALPTVTTTQTVTIGTTNKAKLTAEQIAIATAKGWTVA